MLLAPPLRPVRNRPLVESGRRRSGPNRSYRPPRQPHRNPLARVHPPVCVHPPACTDGRKLSGGLSILAPAVRFTDGGMRMQYMLLIYVDENAPTEAQRE